MLLDSSVIVALLTRESGWEQIASTIENSDSIFVSSATLLETYIVLTSRSGKDATALIEVFVAQIGAEIIPFSQSLWPIAAAAFFRFGKGRHKAALNFGDCIVYATARQAGLPLLFRGNDFSRTDLKPAAWS